MVKVSKIEIEIGDVQVSITLEQAKELYQALGELVGEKIKRVERVIERNPRPWPITYWSTGDQTLKPPYKIICTSDTAKISV